MNWIWINKNEKNTFAEFKDSFEYKGGKVTLRISSDYRYAAYIGKTIVSFGQYPDLPEYKCVNFADLTSFISEGNNTLYIVAWHMGQDFSVCRTMTPSLAFEIIIDGKVVKSSSSETLSRESKNYLPSDLINNQIGYGFNYDFTKEGGEWSKSVEVNTGFVEVQRPIKNTFLEELCIPTITTQGIFKYRPEFGGDTAAKQVQNAWLSHVRFDEMTGKYRPNFDKLSAPLTFKTKGGDGIYIIADMERETTGHLGFTITVDKPCKMILAWGEHLADMRVRAETELRNFALTFELRAGENSLDDYLLRFACRYICIFVEGDSVTLSRLGIREVGYPLAFPKKDFGDKLYNAIYEVGRRTLYLSAHEHYEDGPWREQALYGMDSRNQILFGYGAFGEYEYPRANLMLIGKCLQDNGLIPLTPPAKMIITIPVFTAYWIIAIGENAEADFNKSFAEEILPYAERGLKALLSREGDFGLYLFDEVGYWNFHEWNEGLDGGEIWRKTPIEKEYDANLTALTEIATSKIAYIYEKLGNIEKSEYYGNISERLSKKCENFYNEKTGLYASYIKDGEKTGHHELTQAMLLFSGSVPEKYKNKVCDSLVNPEKYGLTPMTFATLQFKYQAILENGGDIAFILADIEKLFGKMLLSGATSYWETANGEAGCGEGGSLCHGWSAVCCWVMDKYLKNLSL